MLFSRWTCRCRSCSSSASVRWTGDHAIVRAAGESVHTRTVLSLSPFRRLVKDYFLICESYYQAIKTQPPSRIEAIDMGRRGLHDEGSRLLMERLKGKVRYQPIGFELLPTKFTLSQLQHLYETILERPLDKRNFRRKVLMMGFLEETDEIEQDVAHRAARLYRFNEAKYRRLVRQGFLFEL